MTLGPNLGSFDFEIFTIDSHTMGEPTRIIYDGFPALQGSTMMEKKQDLIAHYDSLRRALMLEPRGHRDMFGAVLCKPTVPEAHLGVIFLDSGGCLNMCGHGSMGVATMAVQTGLVPAVEPVTNVILDTPAGLVHAHVAVEHGNPRSVSLQNVPSFLYKQGLSLKLHDGSSVPFDIAFGGSFFALVDASQLHLPLSADHAGALVQLGMELRQLINQQIPVQHPCLDISSVDLVEFYARKGPGSFKNCVVFGDAQMDRSPCGTGTSAKLAALYARRECAPGQPLSFESIKGTCFQGRVLRETSAGPFPAIIPEITGRAFLTGQCRWLLDPNDPFQFGFLPPL